MTSVLITGGHSGIGLAAARTLAARGTDLVLAGRSPDRMRRTAGELSADHGVSVTTLALDTSSLASVRSAAAGFRAMLDSGEVSGLDALVCNAGGRFDGDVSYSPDGYETTFATNCLGHFLLVELLFPHLAGTGRVVYTASGTHDRDSMDGRLVGATVEPDAVALAAHGKDGGRVLSAGKRYSTSKLCTVMYAYELDRRLRRADSAVSSIAFDPGSVPDTGFLRALPKPVRWVSRTAALNWVSKRVGVTTSDVDFSGASLAALAVDPRYADASGAYFQAHDGTLSAVRSARLSYDERRAARLWDDSRRLVHLTDEEEPTPLR
ncbi:MULTISPECIES: SDR family NAD(P)-dependent oxidoreductase [Streptomyces]|uniref:SDR family NAD(P)-dependent oxidoreductase n=1 Tax=Streptomyces doudnae TaxID=3075536 RepID=A0ABD5ELG1_9ACTN|nr:MULTISPECIES: SDR family NAD(P)-dependent oxidoreductase [unclassified Streptomyces]MDT0435518.1 SDR family NAD(P)-dependent oxidoreductase [Streptomyces sp. DSM 41981]MYQ64310.1 SDR family NAD(P)-dependent oxidoreductase [Streptomyces sp. SID4950]SCD76271.1 short chain dehydrogenase [Streptomyces sp. SolWspMP-5a-2]